MENLNIIYELDRLLSFTRNKDLKRIDENSTLENIKEKFNMLSEEYKFGYAYQIAEAHNILNKPQDTIHEYYLYLTEAENLDTTVLPKLSQLELFKFAEESTNGDITNRITDLVSKGVQLNEMDLEKDFVTMKNFKFPKKDLILEMFRQNNIRVKLNTPKTKPLNSYVPVICLKTENGFTSYCNLSNYIVYNNKMELVGTSTMNLFNMLCNGYIYIIANQKFKELKYNYKFLENATNCYIRLVNKIFIRLGNLNLNRLEFKYTSYLFAKFFLKHICKNTVDDTIEKLALKVSELTSEEVVSLTDIDYSGLNRFFETALKHIPSISKINLRDFVSNWLRSYGSSTLFAIEYLPALMCVIYSASLKSTLVNSVAIENATGPHCAKFASNIIGN